VGCDCTRSLILSIPAARAAASMSSVIAPVLRCMINPSRYRSTATIAVARKTLSLGVIQRRRLLTERQHDRPGSNARRGAQVFLRIGFHTRDLPLKRPSVATESSLIRIAGFTRCCLPKARILPCEHPQYQQAPGINIGSMRQGVGQIGQWPNQCLVGVQWRVSGNTITYSGQVIGSPKRVLTYRSLSRISTTGSGALRV